MKISKTKLRKIIKSVILEAFEKGYKFNPSAGVQLDMLHGGHVNQNPNQNPSTLYIFDFDDCLIDSEGLNIVLTKIPATKPRINGQMQGRVRSAGVEGRTVIMRSRETSNLEKNYSHLFKYHDPFGKTIGVDANGNIDPFSSIRKPIGITAADITGLTPQEFQSAYNQYSNSDPSISTKNVTDELGNNLTLAKLDSKVSAQQKSYVKGQEGPGFLRGPRNYNENQFGETVQKPHAPIDVTLDKFEEAINDPDGRVVIITARSPNGSIAMPYIIDQFRPGHLNKYDVYGCGVKGQKLGLNKGSVTVEILKSIESVNNVVVYEDQPLNADQICNVVANYNPNISCQKYIVKGYDDQTGNTRQINPLGAVTYRIDLRP